MNANRSSSTGVVVVLTSLSAGGVAAANVFNMGDGLTSLGFVTVGNPGNGPDLRYGWQSGAVSYAYQIGKFEVTGGQYTEFLNAVAKTDTYGLYDTRMGEWWYCNIQRSGSAGTYSYNVAPNWANRPVNYVTWVNAARFANWLTNGQPSGVQNGNTTEDGSYYLLGADIDPWQQMAIVRKSRARYVIPTLDEWYKAAYHKNDGVTGNYWDYPTGTNSPPRNDLLNPALANSANFFGPDGPIYDPNSPSYLTEVGTFIHSGSPYGTLDQGGNVSEWNETAFEYEWSRFRQGGSYVSEVDELHAGYINYDHPIWTTDEIGFRIAKVPEPVTLAVLALGGLALMRQESKACGARRGRRSRSPASVLLPAPWRRCRSGA